MQVRDLAGLECVAAAAHARCRCSGAAVDSPWAARRTMGRPTAAAATDRIRTRGRSEGDGIHKMVLPASPKGRGVR